MTKYICSGVDVHSFVFGSGDQKVAISAPSRTAALSEYAEIVYFGFNLWVFRIMLNRECGWGSLFMVQFALKILCRQCSEFTWANINNSTSVGFRRREEA